MERSWRERLTRWRRSVVVAGALSVVIALTLTTAGAGMADDDRKAGKPTQKIAATHGIASGDITDRSAVIWSRASDKARMYVEYGTDSKLKYSKVQKTQTVGEKTDYTATVRLNNLKPDTLYYYRVWFSGERDKERSKASKSAVGTFRTAPKESSSRPVSFVFGGDLGGQKYCRRADQGYEIFSKMQQLNPTFFIANGDMIYADGDCPADGPDGPGGWQNIPGDFPGIADPSVNWKDPGQVRDVYLKHWRYNREDPHFQKFLQSTPMYSQWDDHEVINDFGARWSYWNSSTKDRAGYQNLVNAGRDSLFNYSPIARNPRDPNRIYRSFNWGSDLDLLILDARSYRSRNDLADTPENGKTLLGKEQLGWLKKSLLESDATWKVVSSDVPFSIPTGSNAYGRDAWANGAETDRTGFEREMLDLMRFLDEKNIQNVVFVTTDVHFAQNIKYETDADGDGDKFVFHELVTGPLNAVRGNPRQLDPTLNPTSLYAEGKIFNFGYVRLQKGADGKTHLISDVRGENGLPRPGSQLDLTPAAGSVQNEPGKGKERDEDKRYKDKHDD